MKKFIKICEGLKNTNRLNYRTVNGYLIYLQYPVNKNKYFPLSIVEFPVQEIPYCLLDIEL